MLKSNSNCNTINMVTQNLKKHCIVHNKMTIQQNILSLNKNTPFSWYTHLLNYFATTPFPAFLHYTRHTIKLREENGIFLRNIYTCDTRIQLVVLYVRFIFVLSAI